MSKFDLLFRRCSQTRNSAVLTCVVAILLPFGSLANAQASKGHSGGQHLKVGQKHIELVGGAADTALMFVVTTDRDKPVKLRGGMVRVTIMQDGITSDSPVVVDGLNMIVTDLAKPLSKGARIYVSVRLAAGETLRANFTAN